MKNLSCFVSGHAFLVPPITLLLTDSVGCLFMFVLLLLISALLSHRNPQVQSFLLCSRLRDPLTNSSTCAKKNTKTSKTSGLFSHDYLYLPIVFHFFYSNSVSDSLVLETGICWRPQFTPSQTEW